MTELYGAEYSEGRQVTPWLVPSPKRVAQGILGVAALPLSKAQRRECGPGVIGVMLILLALAKWRVVG